MAALGLAGGLAARDLVLEVGAVGDRLLEPISDVARRGGGHVATACAVDGWTVLTRRGW